MQIYSDMFFIGSSTAMQKLLTQLDSLQTIAGWVRDRPVEESIGPLLNREDVVRAYRNIASVDLPEAHLWLSMRPREWSVTNIVPVGSDAISPTNYARLLTSFRMATLAYAESAGVTISEPASDVGPEHFLSQEAYKLLHQFSVLANKSTGASHPRDRARWNAFVIAVHRDSCKVTAGDLTHLLIENEHWPEAKAEELGLLFEYELSLLYALDEAC